MKKVSIITDQFHDKGSMDIESRFKNSPIPEFDFKTSINKKEITKERLSKLKNKEVKKDITSIVNMKNIKYVDSGSFGSIIKFEYNGNYYVMKFIIRIMEFDSKEFILNEKDIDLSYYMDVCGIGPKVLKTFYYIVNNEEIINKPDLYKILLYIKTEYEKQKGIKYKVFEDTENTWYIQCIVMESYQYNAEELLVSKLIDKNVKYNIIKSMFDLMTLQIYKYNLYCFDVKPRNYVVNIKNKIDVKMIDFDTKYCYTDKIYGSDFFVKDLNHQKNVLYISNTIQLILILKKLGIYDQNAQLIIYNLNVISKFRQCSYKERLSFITKYMYYAFKSLKNKITNPATNLLWYGYGYGYGINSSTNISKSDYNEKIDEIMKLF